MRHEGRRQKERGGEDRGTGKKIDHHRGRRKKEEKKPLGSRIQFLRYRVQSGRIKRTPPLPGALVLLLPRHPIGIAQVAAAFP